MTYNEIFETISTAVAEKNDYRVVINFHGDHEGETMLVDFSDCGDDFRDPETVCFWCLQKDVYHGEQWRGTEELDYGSMKDYREVLNFLWTTCATKDCEMYVESF